MASSLPPISSVCHASLLVCAAFGAGCRNDPAEEGLTILVSGDTAGWITPCGCASNQSGGLPRRGELVRKIAADGPVVVVDAGGAPGGTSPYDRSKFEAILRGEKAMGLVAHNIGHGEALFGAEVLRDLARDIGVPWLSANASDRSGKPIGVPVAIIERAGRRIALIGVLDPAFSTETVSVAPVVSSVLHVLEDVRGRYDSAIVLAYLQEDTLRETAALLSEVDVVVGGPTGQPIPPTRDGPTLLTSATNQGKFLVRLDLPGTGRRWEAQIVELDESFDDDATQLDNLKRYHAALAERAFSANETSFAALGKLAKADGTVAGSDRCESCHESECEVWSDSRHAHAWESLEAKSAHVDPDCQRCHTTGYGMAGGYDGLKTEVKRVGVGCESCHGPSLAHVQEPEVRTAWFGREADSCSVCHDHENSPDFDYGVYWPKVAHGDEPDEQQAEEAK